MKRNLIIPVVFLTILLILSCGEQGEVKVDSEYINKKITETINGAFDDLEQIASNYPQLDELENADVGDTYLNYEKGIIGQSKMGGVNYSESGCMIQLEIYYPLTQEKPSQFEASPMIKLKDGQYLQYRIFVEASNSENGKKFAGLITEILTKRMKKLLDEIKE